MPKSATRMERRLAREMLDIMIKCARREIPANQARYAYAAAVRIREEIRGGTLPSTSRVVGAGDDALVIELSPLLTPIPKLPRGLDAPTLPSGESDASDGDSDLPAA